MDHLSFLHYSPETIVLTSRSDFKMSVKKGRIEGKHSKLIICEVWFLYVLNINLLNKYQIKHIVLHVEPNNCLKISKRLEILKLSIDETMSFYEMSQCFKISNISGREIFCPLNIRGQITPMSWRIKTF